MLRFKGGIHPDEHNYTAKSEIIDITPPSFVSISLCGQKPIVAVGDWISVGDPLCENNRAHSSVSGKITEIKNNRVIIESDGYMTKSIALRPFSKKLTDATKEDLISHISRLGIESEGMPLIEIMNNNAEGKILLVSCSENEPFLCSEHRIALEYTKELLLGSKILMKAMSLKKIVFTVNKNYRELYKKLRAVTAALPYADVEKHSSKHPADKKEILIRSYAAAHIKEAVHLSRESFVYCRPSVCTAVFEGFRYGTPIVNRVITVDGDCILKPANFRVPIGCSIEHVLKESSAVCNEKTVLICGGPITGCVVAPDSYVEKSDHGLIALGDKYTSHKVLSCISCGSCHKVCPVGLYPMRFLEGNTEGLTKCIKCGSCSYACPAKLEFNLEGEVK